MSLGVLCNTPRDCVQRAVCRGRVWVSGRPAVHMGTYGNAVAPHCAEQEIGIPPSACALSLLGEVF